MSAPGADWDDVSSDDIEHEEIDLADTLDGVVKELRRYIVALEAAFTTMALWCAHSHLVHHPIIGLTVSPRLGISSGRLRQRQIDHSRMHWLPRTR